MIDDIKIQIASIASEVAGLKMQVRQLKKILFSLEEMKNRKKENEELKGLEKKIA